MKQMSKKRRDFALLVLTVFFALCVVYNGSTKAGIFPKKVEFLLSKSGKHKENTIVFDAREYRAKDFVSFNSIVSPDETFSAISSDTSGGAASGTFPDKPFNGMQIQYSISGVSLDQPVDHKNFTWSRTYKGKIVSKKLTVSGTATASVYGATNVSLTVTVNAGGKTDSFRDDTAPTKTPWTPSFSVSVPVSRKAQSGFFNISLAFGSRSGVRTVEISGNLTRVPRLSKKEKVGGVARTKGPSAGQAAGAAGAASALVLLWAWLNGLFQKPAGGVATAGGPEAGDSVAVKEPEYVDSYDSDTAREELDYHRQNYHSKRQRLESYRKYRAGDKNYARTLRDMEKDVDWERQQIEHYEQMIREHRDNVPADTGPRRRYDPYAKSKIIEEVEDRVREARQQVERQQQFTQIKKAAGRYGEDEILNRLYDNARNPDGSLNVDYIDKARQILKNRIQRGLISYQPKELIGVSGFLEDARHSPWLRITLGIASSGTSEVFYQSQAAWENMQRAYKGAEEAGQDVGFVDMLRTGMGTLAKENLPIEEIQTAFTTDTRTSLYERTKAVALGTFRLWDFSHTARNLKGSLNVIRGGGELKDALRYRADASSLLRKTEGPSISAPRSVGDLPQGSGVDPSDFGIPKTNAKGIQMIADKYGAEVEVRPLNPHSKQFLKSGNPPKHVELKMKTINDLDTKLGARTTQKGLVGYFKPELPEGTKLSDLPAELQKRYHQRLQEYLDQQAKVDKLLAKGKIEVRNGVVINKGLNPDAKTLNKAFTGDADIYGFKDRYTGNPVSDVVKQQMTMEMKAFGVEHGDLQSYKPVDTVGQQIKQSIMDSDEARIRFISDGSPEKVVR